MLKAALREPLLHFLVLAAAIFALYRNVGPASTEEDRAILVSRTRVDQLESVFLKTWGRPPTEAEEKALIDDHVKDEIYSREAVALGLDKNDAVVRRRMRQKLDFLIESEVDATPPSEEELEGYFAAHRDKFALPPTFALQQIYLDPQRHAGKMEQDAQALLKALSSARPPDLEKVGDAAILPAELPLTGQKQIGDLFGADFAASLEKAPVGKWSGPIQSSYGLHLVRVIDRKPGRTPEFSEARASVASEWANDKRKALDAARFAQYRKRYEVTIEPPAKSRQ